MHTFSTDLCTYTPKRTHKAFNVHSTYYTFLSGEGSMVINVIHLPFLSAIEKTALMAVIVSLFWLGNEKGSGESLSKNIKNREIKRNSANIRMSAGIGMCLLRFFVFKKQEHASHTRHSAHYFRLQGYYHDHHRHCNAMQGAFSLEMFYCVVGLINW